MDYKDIMRLDIPVAAAIVRAGDELRLEQMNQEFIKIFGYSEKQLEEVQKTDLILEQDRPLFMEALKRAAQEGGTVSRELRIQKVHQKVCWVEMRCSRLSMEKEEACLILLFWDIDRQKKEELEQRLLNQKYEMMEMLSREYPFDLDVKNWVMLRSHRLMELRGHFEVQDEYYPVDEEILTLCPPDQQPFLNAMKLAAQSEQEGSIDTRFNLSEDGEVPRYLWFRTYYKSVTDTEGNIVRIIGRSFNVDTDKALQDEVRRDPLTKVLNKMEVQQEIDDFFQGEPGGTHIIFLLDIDNFKGVNDHFGHTFGDSVIIEVADLIKSQFRMNDVIGRVGGDEFLVLMKNSSLEKAEEKAETLCQLLAKEYTGGEVHYHITISAGLAVYGVDGSDYSSLFEKADHALYRAKQAGKNGYEVATRNDIGPIVRNIRTIEQRENISAEDHNFLTFAFNLMAHAKNLDGSLNMLLKRLAEQYQLDLVTVFENDALHKTMTMTNYFGSDYNFYEESVFTEIHPTVNELQPGNYVIIDQDAFTDRYKVKARIKSTAPVDMERSFSAVVGKFEYIGNQTGEIFYIRMGKEPTWQKGELEMFQELTRTIAIFVSLRFRMDESEAQIRYIQNRDQLTKLYNQEAFRKVMNEFMQQTDPDKVYALEYLDINNFGYINDNYGYKVGDNVLKMFAKDASEQPSFCAGCRLYSDFFLILTTDRDADTVIANLQSQSRRFSNMQNHQYPNSGMGVTAGVYIIEDTKMDVDVAIENANLAWKYAKNSGRRDIVVYDATQRSRRADEQKVIGEFFEALYRDDFQMYLQPKFILGDRTVYGAEALARWKRPDGQILAPAYFIDSLEKIGYITELDFYIFEEVLKTLDKWDKQKKRKIVISTNFSGRHFDTDGEEFLNRIQHIMSKYTVSPQYIEIEVTEGVLIENIDVLEYCMNRLHEMGFRVAIDDFGTGYSSLSVLADMPADVVKIDKSFINKDMTDRKMSLLYEIGRMVKILNKDIIIEGVETQEQEQFLKEGGFTCGQGYLCNKPIPIGQFERLYL